MQTDWNTTFSPYYEHIIKVSYAFHTIAVQLEHIS